MELFIKATCKCVGIVENDHDITDLKGRIRA